MPRDEHFSTLLSNQLQAIHEYQEERGNPDWAEAVFARAFALAAALLSDAAPSKEK